MNIDISAGSLFLEGLLSFFSPCVLPLIPLYISYLTADAREENPDGSYSYRRRKTFFLTLCFVLGICTVFFLAGLGSAALRTFFAGHRTEMWYLGGVLLIFFGLVSLHVIDIPLLNRTYQKNVEPGKGMSYVKAWMMGFFFSFAWSPCIGPMLAQAIVMSSAAETASQGWLLIGSYTLGFILMFLLLGLFTGEILNFLKDHRNIVKYTGIAAGIIVLLMGFYMIYQGYETSRMPSESTAGQQAQESTEEYMDPTLDEFDFTLPDWNGNTVTLSDAKGKVIILSLYETWCHYCNEELPSLQKVHETMDDVQVYLVTTPSAGSEGSKEYITQYLKDSGITIDVLFDEQLEMTRTFAVSGYPMTFFIDKEGVYTGYFPGYTPEETLMDYISTLRGNN